ncbi:MAG: SRPBCC domain-containing protein [Solirubrobacterales bacterium]
MNEFKLQVRRTFDSPREDVFEAWTSPEVLRRWMGAGQDWTTPTAEVDLRPGGRIRVSMAETGGDPVCTRSRAPTSRSVRRSASPSPSTIRPPFLVGVARVRAGQVRVGEDDRREELLLPLAPGSGVLWLALHAATTRLRKPQRRSRP